MTQYRCYMCDSIVQPNETGFSTAYRVTIKPINENMSGARFGDYGVCCDCAAQVDSDIQLSRRRKK